MSAETFNSIMVVVSLLPWLGFIIAMMLSLALDVRDTLRANRVHERVQGERAGRLPQSAHRRKAA